MNTDADPEMLCARCREPKRADEFPRKTDPEKPLHCLACQKDIRRGKA